MTKKARRQKSTKKKPRKASRTPARSQPDGAVAQRPEAKEISQNSSASRASEPTQFIGAPIVDPSVIAGPVIEPKKAKAAPPPPPPAPEPAAEDPIETVVAEELIADAAPEPDPMPKAAPTPKPAPKAAPQKEVVVQKQGLAGGLIGGVIAAAIGFGAAQLYPDGWPVGTDPELESAIAAQSSQIEALGSELEALSAAAADTAALDALQAQLTDLTAQVTAAQDALAQAQAAIAGAGEAASAEIGAIAADLTNRVVTLEKAPIEQAADAAVAVAVQAYEAEVAALRDETRERFDALAEDLQARLGEGNAAIVEALEANKRLQDERAEREAAARAAEEAARRAQAMASISAALETGAPFDGALTVLPDAPAPLPELAADGVPTSAELSEAFPPLARTALTVALRETSDGSVEDRATTFLRTQLGIRSLTPQEGDDPDAVLSRMEAAVADGDYDTAVAEADALPDPARAILSDWLSAVQSRNAALSAAAALAAELNTN